MQLNTHTQTQSRYTNMKCGNFLALNQFALKTKPQHSTQQTHTHTLTNWNLSLVFCFSLAQQCANNGPEAILSTTTTLIYFTVVDKIIANVRLEVDPAEPRETHTHRYTHSWWEGDTQCVREWEGRAKSPSCPGLVSYGESSLSPTLTLTPSSVSLQSFHVALGNVFQ